MWESVLVTVDKYLGWLYRSMFKVITNSGDFIQGLKVLLKREPKSIIKSIFDLGIAIAVGFIVLDIIMILADKEVMVISIYSKMISLLFIIAFKYNLVDKLKKLKQSSN